MIAKHQGKRAARQGPRRRRSGKRSPPAHPARHKPPSARAPAWPWRHSRKKALGAWRTHTSRGRPGRRCCCCATGVREAPTPTRAATRAATERASPARGRQRTLSGTATASRKIQATPRHTTDKKNRQTSQFLDVSGVVISGNILCRSVWLCCDNSALRDQSHNPRTQHTKKHGMAPRPCAYPRGSARFPSRRRALESTVRCRHPRKSS